MMSPLLSYAEIILSLTRDFPGFFRPLSHSRLKDAKAGNQAPRGNLHVAGFGG